MQKLNRGKKIMKEKMDKGFVQIYTGNGKGKTTAALGLALRAAGAGMKSYIIQFMKEYPYSEVESLKNLNHSIEIEQCGGDDFVYKKELPPSDELKKAAAGLRRAKDKMISGNYDLVVLDEVCVAIYFKLFNTIEVLDFIKSKPANVELILTGRYCPQELIDAADLVTEMKEVKHYYQTGVLTRKGIES
ncbi:MAG TPA: cob(I)yrinic acid a,c-diamide adenosyltransferase [Melioribacteraceae bacterium]|nr:cob(I)yrinic acid a,c-diamide adenosyltransferase [Melioribacteraceae bacterium]